jgi:hypothetical protein
MRLDGFLKDKRIRSIRADKGGGLRTIDHPHSRLHDGAQWVFLREFTNLAAGASVNMAIVATSGKRLHVEAIVSADAAGTGRVFKAPTYSAGTAIVGVNPDFDINASAPAAVVHTPTIGADGNPFHSASLASGAGNSGGGQSNTRYEFIVSETSPALIRFTAKGNSTNGSITLIAYEEEVS